MSSYNRRFVIALPLALAACGFQPVYGPGGAGRALNGKVGFEPPATEDAYLLVRALEDRLGRAGTPDYILTFKTTIAPEGQAVTATGAITRFSLVGRASYVLTRAGSDVKLAEGDVRNFAGYSATGSTVEALAAETDARQRLMVILADQIVTRLYATPGLGA
ncbi:LPS assembly lipoprotein LptE [Seohaeicola zhoushanensis]|uniref:LPS-assembly lipoprotein n=1 Tax=Seohaeicola zhoushanensis TaxID=1569283 RepID=A0A8J3M4F4_9RHOB|nr:LPS assembly lipoprotein LptE [Seohaeicola zhoushanensis]GHF34626.1 hypothetical protein GCM10017056_02610 [Seohaeicola zhoushanensis]